MSRRSVIVEGFLAFRVRRIGAARRGEAGAQILPLPQLAARLAGGFIRPTRSQGLDPAIQVALEGGGFAELERVRQLPGTTRSVSWTLAKMWRADLALEDLAKGCAGLGRFDCRCRKMLAMRCSTISTEAGHQPTRTGSFFDPPHHIGRSRDRA
jgi:hypothetical protein